MSLNGPPHGLLAANTGRVIQMEGERVCGMQTDQDDVLAPMMAAASGQDGRHSTPQAEPVR